MGGHTNELVAMGSRGASTNRCPVVDRVPSKPPEERFPERRPAHARADRRARQAPSSGFPRAQPKG